LGVALPTISRPGIDTLTTHSSRTTAAATPDEADDEDQPGADRNPEPLTCGGLVTENPFVRRLATPGTLGAGRTT
jgi:hypothetical protein